MTRPSSNRWHMLRIYLAPQWLQIVVLAVLLFSNTGLELVSPFIVRTFLDTTIAGGDFQVLLRIALLYGGVALVAQLVTVGETHVATNVGQIAVNRLRADVTLHCLQLDPSFYHTHGAGELIERVDGDVSTMGNFFSRFVVQLGGNGLLMIGILALSFGIDWRVGIGLTSFAVVSILVLHNLRDVVVPYQKAMRQADAAMFGFLEEYLSGTEDLRSNGATGHALRRLYERARAQLQIGRRASLAGGAAFGVTTILLAVGAAVALGIGGSLYLSGAITVGTVYQIFAYAEMLRRPINEISRQIEDLQRATASIDRIADLLQTRSAVIDGTIDDLSESTGAVVFEQVTFGYDPNALVLQDLSFDVPAGTVLGLLGRTGSGKTTITRLLFRMYDPLQGTVRVGRHDIRTLRRAAFRRYIGLVTQDVLLFHASLRDNLTFFDPDVTDAQIVQVLCDLGLDSWYRRLPNGLDTLLGPDGSDISAGEAQLIAFARVFLQNPRLVILDEASSRLDVATEQIVERAINRLLEGRTAIIIAHRLQTVQRADTILILENRRAVEYGSRTALARDANSRFSQLLRTGLEEILV